MDNINYLLFKELSNNNAINIEYRQRNKQNKKIKISLITLAIIKFKGHTVLLNIQKEVEQKNQ